MFKTLICCALLCEAQALINLLGLVQDNSTKNLPKNAKLFTDKKNKYLLIVCGIGKDNCIKALEFIFKNFHIEKAINLGIAGCSDGSIKTGTLFCTNKLLPNINFAPVTSLGKPLENDENLQTILVDMEAKYFLETSKKYCDNIFIFKVVSDYLETTIPKKSFVIKIIANSLKSWKKYL